MFQITLITPFQNEKEILIKTNPNNNKSLNNSNNNSNSNNQHCYTRKAKKISIFKLKEATQ